MDHTAHWQVNELVIRMIVATRIRDRGLRIPWKTSGGHGELLARVAKYAAKRPEKNMISEVMNRIIPRIGLLIPPRA
jgi:hypothetical protein